MMGMSFGSFNAAILLVALGLGYIVCYLANREEKTLRTTGYLIGIFMMLLSGILLLNNLLSSARFCGKMAGMMRPKHMMMSTPPAASQPQP